MVDAYQSNVNVVEELPHVCMLASGYASVCVDACTCVRACVSACERVCV